MCRNKQSIHGIMDEIQERKKAFEIALAVFLMTKTVTVDCPHESDYEPEAQAIPGPAIQSPDTNVNHDNHGNDKQ